MKIIAPPSSTITLPTTGSIFLGSSSLLGFARGSVSHPPCSETSPHVLMAEATIVPPANLHLKMSGANIAGPMTVQPGTALVVPFPDDDDMGEETLVRLVVLPRTWALPKSILTQARAVYDSST